MSSGSLPGAQQEEFRLPKGRGKGLGVFFCGSMAGSPALAAATCKNKILTERQFWFCEALPCNYPI